MINKHLLYFTFIIIFTSFAYPANARCKSQQPRSFMNYETEKTEYIITKDVNSLTTMHGKIGPRHVLGLAGGEVGAKFTAEFDLERETDGMYCLYVDKVNIVFFAKPKVYIASNFKKGTCEYSQVLRHEEKHVKTLKRAHKDYMSRFRSHMRWSLRNLPVFDPMSADEANEKKDEYVQIISKHITGFIEKINEDVAERQKKVDSKDEYARVLKNCSRWDDRLSVND